MEMEFYNFIKTVFNGALGIYVVSSLWLLILTTFEYEKLKKENYKNKKEIEMLRKAIDEFNE